MRAVLTFLVISAVGCAEPVPPTDGHVVYGDAAPGCLGQCSPALCGADGGATPYCRRGTAPTYCEAPFCAQGGAFCQADYPGGPAHMIICVPDVIR